MTVHQPKIMGVVNVTPDSFSDGGKYLSVDSCLSQIDDLIEQGADIVELGAESSRPGSSYISEEGEWERLAEILAAIAVRKLPTDFSIDTRKSRIMRRAVDFGITYFNNIEGLVDSETLGFLAKGGHKYIAMHMHQSPLTMQENPLNHFEALQQVSDFFRQSHAKLIAAGFSGDSVFLDPGIGFGKTDTANLALIGSVQSLAQKYQVAIGVSRKGFLGRVYGADSIEQRDLCSKVMETALLQSGARIIRTHHVRPIAKIRNSLFQQGSINT